MKAKYTKATRPMAAKKFQCSYQAIKETYPAAWSPAAFFSNISQIYFQAPMALLYKCLPEEGEARVPSTRNISLSTVVT